MSFNKWNFTINVKVKIKSQQRWKALHTSPVETPVVCWKTLHWLVPCILLVNLISFTSSVTLSCGWQSSSTRPTLPLFAPTSFVKILLYKSNVIIFMGQLHFSKCRFYIDFRPRGRIVVKLSFKWGGQQCKPTASRPELHRKHASVSSSNHVIDQYFWLIISSYIFLLPSQKWTSSVQCLTSWKVKGLSTGFGAIPLSRTGWRHTWGKILWPHTCQVITSAPTEANTHGENSSELRPQHKFQHNFALSGVKPRSREGGAEVKAQRSSLWIVQKQEAAGMECMLLHFAHKSHEMKCKRTARLSVVKSPDRKKGWTTFSVNLF